MVVTDYLKHNMVGGPRLALRRTLCNAVSWKPLFRLHEWEFQRLSNWRGIVSLPPRSAPHEEFAPRTS